VYCTCVAAATVLCGHARFCTYNDVWTELDSSSAIRLLLYRRPITLDFYVINPIRLHYCQLRTIYHASSSTSSANGLLLRRPVSVEHTAAPYSRNSRFASFKDALFYFRLRRRLIFTTVVSTVLHLAYINFCTAPTV